VNPIQPYITRVTPYPEAYSISSSTKLYGKPRALNAINANEYTYLINSIAEVRTKTTNILEEIKEVIEKYKDQMTGLVIAEKGNHIDIQEDNELEVEEEQAHLDLQKMYRNLKKMYENMYDSPDFVDGNQIEVEKDDRGVYLINEVLLSLLRKLLQNWKKLYTEFFKNFKRENLFTQFVRPGTEMIDSLKEQLKSPEKDKQPDEQRYLNLRIFPFLRTCYESLEGIEITNPKTKTAEKITMRVQEKVILEKLTALINRRKVLEYGCGRGELFETYAKAGARVIMGCDIVPQMITESTEEGRKVEERYETTVVVYKRDLEREKGIMEKTVDVVTIPDSFIGNFADQESILKKAASEAAETVIVTFYAEDSVDDRTDFYNRCGMDIKVEEEHRTGEKIFFASNGFISRVYTVETIKKMFNLATVGPGRLYIIQPTSEHPYFRMAVFIKEFNRERSALMEKLPSQTGAINILPETIVIDEKSSLPKGLTNEQYRPSKNIKRRVRKLSKQRRLRKFTPRNDK
jgi:predicted RNA methylase